MKRANGNSVRSTPLELGITNLNKGNYIMNEDLELTLSVNEWNVVIGALHVLAFADAKAIIDVIAEQSKDSKAVGEETVTIKICSTKFWHSATENGCINLGNVLGFGGFQSGYTPPSAALRRRPCA